MPRKSQKSAPPGYLTAKQSMELIGIQRSTFYTLLNRGDIKKGDIPPGHKEAVYREPEIKMFARKYRDFMERTLRFELALPDDIEPIRDMVARESGGYNHAIPHDVMEAWMRKNNRSVYVLRRGAEIVGYVSMFPLDEETIIKRMTGEYWNRSIPLESVQWFEPGTTIKLYIAELTVNQHQPDHHRLAARLIREVLSLLVSMSQDDHITIEEIYAVATTAFGVNACQKLHMEPMTYLPAGVRPADNRIPYKMDVKNNQSHLFGRYRELTAK